MDKQNEIATILAYGDIHGDAAAATQFGKTLRTVQRYRRKVKDATDPELVRAVAEKAKHVAAQHGELMDQVLELGLQQLKVRVLTASSNKAPIDDRSLIGAIKVLFEQRVTRDFLTHDEDDFSACHDQSSAASEGATSQAQGSQAKSDPAVH